MRRKRSSAKGGKQTMETSLRILAYLVVFLLLIMVNCSFVTAVFNEFSTRGLTIAPIQVIGQKDDDGKLGAALARMLQARLTYLEQQMTNAQNTLLNSPPDSTGSGKSTRLESHPMSILPLFSTHAVDIPIRLFEPANIKVAVSGVDVGGILPWLQRAMIRSRAVEFTVYINGDKATITGNIDALSSSNAGTLWLQCGASPEQITDAISFALLQDRLTEDQGSKVGSLTPAEFGSLLQTLVRTAELNRQVALGRPVRDEYAALLPGMEELATKAPRWYELIYLTATIADSGGDISRALAYYQQLQQLAISGQQDHPRVSADLQQRVAVRVKALSPIVGSAREKNDVIARQKIEQQAQVATMYLNDLLKLNLPVPPVTLLDANDKNSYWSEKSIHVPPQAVFLPDLVYHEAAWPFILQVAKKPVLEGETGAIAQSYCDVFASLVKQSVAKETAQTADWEIAPGGVAWYRGEDPATSQDRRPIISMKSPGSAYRNDPILGSDKFVGHYSKLYRGQEDSGGVHYNSGIPDKAFYEVAIRIGSDAAGKVWAAVLGDIGPKMNLKAFADRTFDTAGKLFGIQSDQQKAVSQAWKVVGISVGKRPAVKAS